MSATYILGISAYYHDSAAALLKDGEAIAAVQQERFTRKKHDSSYPSQAIKYCLNEANLSLVVMLATLGYAYYDGLLNFGDNSR